MSKVETRGIIFDKCSHIMAYADDVIVMGKRLQDIKEVFISLFEKTNKSHGLEINKKLQNLLYDIENLTMEKNM
jgi:hypothetical protein